VSKVVLDASALLAYLNDEPGGDDVPLTGGEAVISSVNLAEAISVLTSRGGGAELIRAHLSALSMEVVPLDRASAERAGFLIAKTKRRGLSLGDRCCLALAGERGLPVMTTDRVWSELDLGLTIHLLR